MSRVWVELTCYAASHCRAEAQAQVPSKGSARDFYLALDGNGEQLQINEGHARAKLIGNVVTVTCLIILIHSGVGSWNTLVSMRMLLLSSEVLCLELYQATYVLHMNSKRNNMLSENYQLSNKRCI